MDKKIIKELEKIKEMKNIFFEKTGNNKTSREEMKKNLIRVLLKHGFKYKK